MARQGRSADWGFPRWRGYGGGREAAAVRLCDRSGCENRGDCPAPKSPNNPDRWYFCPQHAAEYNAGWNYFEGLDKEEAEQREQAERGDTSGYRQSAYDAWAGPGDGSRSRDEMRALEALGLEADADFEAVRKAWRTRAKEVHPDLRPGDKDAAAEFLKLQTAYEVLRAAEERREWKGPDGG
ncbi:MAG: J domain-containing protein [Novosphingobium sp.]